MRVIWLFSLFLVFVLNVSCSHSLKNDFGLRNPAEQSSLIPSEVQVFNRLVYQLSSGLTDARRAELEIIKDNFAKFFILAAGRPLSEQTEIINKALEYVQVERQKLLRN